MRLLIDGAMVWNGTGAAPFAGKVLIDGERIAAVAPQAETVASDGAERLDAARQLVLVAISIAPPLGRGLERIERHHQAPRRDLDVGIDRLGIAGPVGVTIAHGRQRAPSRRPAARQQNPRFGKRLEHEIYVASEPSATPTRSYALLSNF